MDTPRRVGTPRGIRRERDLPTGGQRDKYNDQFRNLEIQVCSAIYMDSKFTLYARLLAVFVFRCFCITFSSTSLPQLAKLALVLDSDCKWTYLWHVRLRNCAMS